MIVAKVGSDFHARHTAPALARYMCLKPKASDSERRKTDEEITIPILIPASVISLSTRTPVILLLGFVMQSYWYH